MSLTLSEARARAALVTDVAYDIDLDVTDRDTFKSTTTVRFTCLADGTSTFLELFDATEVEVTGADAWEHRDHRIHLTGLAAGAHEITVSGRLPYVTNGDGMHTFTDPADGETYVSAYLGMDMAHHVFACFDQPDIKAPLAVTAIAPESWIVIGNGVGTRDAGDWTFATTPPISPYLFVLCAGPWHSVTWEYAGLPFGWHARRSLAPLLDRDAEVLRRITEACFDHYTATFAPAYAFDSYDQVLVPEHNWGALETPGAVTFRDEMLFRGEPTPMQRVARASVIAHEMAHMWFGDLVTFAWWEDSWLNESFADYMGFHVALHAVGEPDAWTSVALRRKTTGYRADARRSTHPIAEDAESMVDVDTAFGNFDQITYAKGSATLRQLVTWLGEETFVAGANAYLSAHAFGNATLSDFLTALDDVSDRDVRTWAERWLRTTGFDTLRVTRRGDVPVLQRDGSRPHRLTVAAYDDDGRLVGSRLVDLADEPVELAEYAGRAVLPNSGDETFAQLDLDEQTWAFLRSHLSSIQDPLARAVAWWGAVSSTRAGTLPVDDLLGLVARHLSVERHPMVFEGALSLTSDLVVTPLLTPEALAGAEEVVAAACTLALAGPLEPALAVAAARGLAHTTSDSALLREWLASGRVEGFELDRDLRWLVVRRLVALGADPTIIDAELADDPTASGQLGARAVRAAIPTAEAKAAAWVEMYDGEPSNRVFTATAAGFWTAGQADLVAPYLARYAAETPAVAERRGQAYSLVVGNAFPFLPLATADLQGLRDALAARLEAGVTTVLARTWNDRLDDLDVALRLRG
ncbi:aminopeptidase N [Nocardioides sp. LHG3406-4]|uniref:aminopeptidase N n=1 Tax=Nocardioides sp. LHG3406-4 TaxID=2804575 RepID=UPI003CEBA13F